MTGCPCTGDCCKNPSVHTPEHECSEDDEDVCEECYASECDNCEKKCYCDL